jgi:hypothetical protein
MALPPSSTTLADDFMDLAAIDRFFLPSFLQIGGFGA